MKNVKPKLLLLALTVAANFATIQSASAKAFVVSKPEKDGSINCYVVNILPDGHIYSALVHEGPCVTDLTPYRLETIPDEACPFGTKDKKKFKKAEKKCEKYYRRQVEEV